MKVGVISLGCAKNQVDTENMLGILASSGYRFVSNPSEADILIVNTCGFILPAKEESIQAILEMAQYKVEGSCSLLVVTGCLSERYRNELIEEIPEVDIFLGVHEYEKLPFILSKKLNTSCKFNNQYNRILVSPKHRAYLRIGDGCNNRCSYCAIPLIRGNLKSVPIEKLIEEARDLADHGVSELSLIAQDTSGYGKDIYDKPQLIKLLKELCKIDSFRWIRLLYTYPDTVTPELLDTIAENSKLVPYLDMPLQHCNDSILKSMNRRGNKAHIQSILNHLYKYYPDFTLRTTIMVGYPGETDAQFKELLDFLRDNPFDRLGAFTFSPEEGTKAADIPNQVPDEVKQERYDRLMIQQQDISRKRNEQWIGKELQYLIEETGFDGTYGRTIREAPDADGFVKIAPNYTDQPGQFIPIKITKADAYDMLGERI